MYIPGALSAKNSLNREKKLSSAPIRRGVLGEGFYLMHIKVLVGGD